MNKLDFSHGVLYINDYKVSLGGLAELLDILHNMKDTEIVDVDVIGDDVVCTFADGEIQTAHCHPTDIDKWSLETGIAICIGKYVTGGSNAFNRLVHQGVEVFKKKAEDESENGDFECSECDDRFTCEDSPFYGKDKTDEKDGEEKKPSLSDLFHDFGLIKDILNALGLEVEVEVKS